MFSYTAVSWVAAPQRTLGGLEAFGLDVEAVLGAEGAAVGGHQHDVVLLDDRALRLLQAVVVERERRLACSREAEKEEADVAELGVGPDDAKHLRSGVEPEASTPLDPVHRLAEHGFLRLAGVVGAEDVGVALVDVEEDQALRPVRDVNGEEVRLLRRVGREEHAVPHVRDAGVLARDEKSAVDGDFVIHPHPAVHLDEVHLRELLLDLSDGLLRLLPLDRLLHDADRRAVRDDVGVFRGTVLHAGGVDGRPVLARLLARAGELPELVA
jgi:hypothetical protein